MKKKLLIAIGSLFLFIVCFIVGKSLLPVSFSLDSNSNNSRIYVGYGRESINPEVGPVPLAGYGNTYLRPAEIDSDNNQRNLYITAVALKDNSDNIIVFLTCDLVTIKYVGDSIRNAISDSTGLPIDKIMVSATHTHSAPDTGFSNSSYPDLKNNISAYKQLVKERAVNAVNTALNNFKLATVYAGTTDIVNSDGSNALNFVRHYTTSGTYEDGTPVYRGSNHGYYVWDGTKYISSSNYVNGHTTKADSTLQMIKFEIDGDKDILMVNWQAHPTITGGNSNDVISSDYIGSVRDVIEEEHDCYFAYYQGAAGNISFSTMIKDGSEGISDISYNTTSNTNSKYGQKLAEYISNAFDDLEKVKIGNISTKQEQYGLNLAYLDLDDVYNQNLLKNAKYLAKIRGVSFKPNESTDHFRDIINGKYDWGDFDFPEGYDATGEALRNLISTYSSSFSKIKINDEPDENGYTYTYKSGITVSTVNTLINLIGVNFENKIQSKYHASSIVRNADYEQGQTENIEINAIIIGDISFVTAPYEMFDTNGMFIKNNSPSKMTFILGYTNNAYGYIPSSNAYDYGCYEADTTRFKKGSGEELATEFVSMLNEVNSRITNVSISSLPDKTKYIINKENLDLTGGSITVSYANGNDVVIPLTNSDVTVTGFDNTSLGTKTITVNYSDVTTTFDVEIINDSVKKIEVTSNPTKTKYIINKENLDLTGGKLAVTYTSGTTDTISLNNERVSVTGFDNKRLGTNELTIKYNNLETTLNVYIIQDTITGINVTTMPTKTKYLLNTDKLDLTGGSITVTYASGDSSTVALTNKDINVSGFDNKKEGVQTITVSYNNFKSTFNVEVINIKEEEKDNDVDVNPKTGKKLYYFGGLFLVSIGLVIFILRYKIVKGRK